MPSTQPGCFSPELYGTVVDSVNDVASPWASESATGTSGILVVLVLLGVVALVCMCSCGLLAAKRKRRLKQYSRELSEQGVEIQDELDV